jgi:hypothetical protein
MKHPRAANFCWRCTNGTTGGDRRYLYWFHNHGGRWYEDGNPVWLCGGVEVNTPQGPVIRWSQPEIVLYDDDPYIRMSYPDLVEQDGRTYLTETQKDVARVHEVERTLLDGLWGQFEVDAVACIATEGLVLSLPDTEEIPSQVLMPELPPFLQRSTRADHGAEDLCEGFTIDVWLRLETLATGQVLLDNRTPAGQGFCLQTTDHGTISIVLNDGRTECRWATDPGLLVPNSLHHVVVIVDGGPKVISFVVDGTLNDGGASRQFGWGRYSPHLRGVEGESVLRIADCVQGLRLYNRHLRTSEAIANYNAEHAPGA